jgi:hypothetical protein
MRLMRRIPPLTWSVWVGLMAAPISARAHEYWLSPSSYDAAPHPVFEIGAVAGTGFRGERKPWDSPRCVRFEARVARVLDLTKVARNGETIWARLAPTDGGGALLDFESGFSSIELPAAQFESYLSLEGLDGPLSSRHLRRDGGPGRERYRRCAKAWLSGAADARALAVVGLPLELVPLSVPGSSGTLGFRLLFEGHPLERALVKAWRRPLGIGGATRDPEARDSVNVAWQGRTDAHGLVTVPVQEPGEWLVSVVHMVPSADRAAADWESSWASFTFEQRGEPQRR